MKNGLFYRCEKCGNLITIVLSGGGDLICCGQPMTLLVANSVDASKEKHLPVVLKNNGNLDVTIGSVLHPMTPEHYIEWIALITEGKMEIIYLKPGDEPKAHFLYSVSSEKKVVVYSDNDDEPVLNCEGSPCSFSYNELIEDAVSVYAYCNLHGLWQTTI